MKAFRSILVFLWLVVCLIPLATSLIITAIFLRGDRLYYWYVKPFVALVIGGARLVGGVNYEVQGLDNLPAADDNQPIILASKHQSTWETFAYITFMSHPLSFVFKKELLRIPFFGWAIGLLEMVHIDRSKRKEAWEKVASQGQELMNTGHWIIMFPEGTRSDRGHRGRYQRGAARLAVATGASIVPIAVTSGRCWPRRSFAMIPGTIDVSIAKPIASAGRNEDDLMAEVEVWIESEMRRLDPEAYND